jgi:hypothetical protein
MMPMTIRDLSHLEGGGGSDDREEDIISISPRPMMTMTTPSPRPMEWRGIY